MAPPRRIPGVEAEIAIEIADRDTQPARSHEAVDGRSTKIWVPMPIWWVRFCRACPSPATGSYGSPMRDNISRRLLFSVQEATITTLAG